jgi:hypothetical protein
VNQNIENLKIKTNIGVLNVEAQTPNINIQLITSITMIIAPITTNALTVGKNLLFGNFSEEK